MRVVNIGVSSMAALRGPLLQGRGRRWGVQCQKLAAEPKPELYPRMNPEQQALPSFLNSCHMSDGKQVTSRNSVWARAQGAQGELCGSQTRLEFVSNDCLIYIQDAVVVAFSRALRFPLVPQTWRDVTSRGVRDPTTIWLHDPFFLLNKGHKCVYVPPKKSNEAICFPVLNPGSNPCPTSFFLRCSSFDMLRFICRRVKREDFLSLPATHAAT